MLFQYLVKSFPHFHRVPPKTPCGNLWKTQKCKKISTEKKDFHRFLRVFHSPLWKFFSFIFNDLTKFSTFPQPPTTTRYIKIYIGYISSSRVLKFLI